MASECSVCGVSGDKERLLEAVSLKRKGITKICGSCARKEGVPVIKRPTTFQLKESEKEHRIYKRPTKNSRVPGQGSFRGVSSKRNEDSIGLKEIVDRNYEKTLATKEKKPRPDLVENFHWVIMRARRSKKLTREQLAREISESVSAIKMAEQGILPDDDYILLNKIESFLGVKLSKGELKRPWKQIETKEPARVIKFDPLTMKNLTIDDLRKLKEMKENSVQLGDFDNFDFEEGEE